MRPREPAWRMFAYEFNSITTELRDDEASTPAYLLSPLGAKVRRIFVVGVLTELHNHGTDHEPFWDARIVDPTGVFRLRAGTYQAPSAAVLGRLTPPVFLGFIGKARAYSPEEGRLFVSVWPENLRLVDRRVRDYWQFETCRSTIERLRLFRHYLTSNPDRAQDNAYASQESERQGYDYLHHLLSGIKSALAIYGQPHFDRYIGLVTSVLRELGHANGHDPGSPEARMTGDAAPLSPTLLSDEGRMNTPELSMTDTHNGTFYRDGGSPLEAVPPDIEQQLLGIIRKSEEGVMGAAYDEVIDAAVEEGMNQHAIDDVMDLLMDKGLIYEPVLGRIKTN